MQRRRVAVVGAGWAGLAAAVRACEQGHDVRVLEMATVPGGRARTVQAQGLTLDNGQHILIGAYVRTLALMARVGAAPERCLARLPLTLLYPDGRGLRMPPGPPLLGFARAVWGFRGWRWPDKLAMLTAAGRWAASGFRCDESLTADALCRTLPAAVRELLIDPLCIAALNTPAAEASASVLLRVLRDALFKAPGSADLLLPRVPLGELLPEPAVAWLQAHGAAVECHRRINTIAPGGRGWTVDGEPFDVVVLACPAAVAASLVDGLAPAWAAAARSLRYEPIITAVLHAPARQLAAPMLALASNDRAPAQFAFDHGQIGAAPGRFTFVVSGAAPWVDRGLDQAAEATLAQAHPLLGPASLVHIQAEKRATFRCTPGLTRPAMVIAAGLLAAGDYVDGPYPATLEGAVLSGEAAAAALGRDAANATPPPSRP